MAKALVYALAATRFNPHGVHPGNPDVDVGWV
jgi:hypothetical protein